MASVAIERRSTTRSSWVSRSFNVWRPTRSLLITTAELGYKQELRRQYSTLEIFAVAFSIMGLVPSIASTIAFSLPAGPVGMVWVGYFPFVSFPYGCANSDRDGLRRVSSSSLSVLRWYVPESSIAIASVLMTIGGYGVRDAHGRRSILVDTLFRG